MSEIFKDVQCLDQLDLTCRLPECFYRIQFISTRWKAPTSVLYYMLHSRIVMYIEPRRLMHRLLWRIPLFLCENHCLWELCEMRMHVFTQLWVFNWRIKLNFDPFWEKKKKSYAFLVFLIIQAKRFLLLFYFLVAVIFLLAGGPLGWWSLKHSWNE